MEQLEDLDFAGDLSLLASNWNQLQTKLNRMKLHSRAVPELGFEFRPEPELERNSDLRSGRNRNRTGTGI